MPRRAAGTAPGGADEGEVDAWLLEDRANPFVFNLVESERHTANGGHFLAPRTAPHDTKRLVDVADGATLVMRVDLGDGVGIVGVDEQGEALGARPTVGPGARERAEVGGKLRRARHGVVVHEAVAHVLAQQRIERRVQLRWWPLRPERDGERCRGEHGHERERGGERGTMTGDAGDGHLDAERRQSRRKFRMANVELPAAGST